MGGFNLPWGANAAPRVAGPQQGSMGGIQGPPPGTSPYPVNGVAQGAAALGQLFTQFGQMKEQEKAKDHQEFQDMMQLQSLGLPVDMQKMQKLGKKVFGKYIDFNNPMPQQQQPQQPPPGGGAMPSQPNMPGMIGMSQNPQGQMGPAGGPPMMPPMGGGGMPPGMGPQTPPFMPSSQMPQGGMPQQGGPGGVLPPGGTPPFMPSQGQPGAQQQPWWMRMASAAGMTKDAPVNPQSAGAQAMQQMAAQAKQGGQMQRGMSAMQYQAAMQDFAYKQRMMGLQLAAAGIGSDGQPLSEEDTYRARSILSGQKKALEGQDANDLRTQLTEARRAGATQEQLSAVVDNYLNAITGVHKKADFMMKGIEGLTKEGASLKDAYQISDSMWNGKPISADVLMATSPKAMKEASDRWFDTLKMYPALASAPPEVIRAARALNNAGDSGGISQMLRGMPTSEQMKNTREDKQLGIAGANAQTQRGQLDLSRNEFSYKQKNDAQKQVYDQSLSVMRETTSLFNMQGKKLTDQQWQVFMNSLSNVSGMSVMPTTESGAANKNWFSPNPSVGPAPSAADKMKALSGGLSATPAQPSPEMTQKLMKWAEEFLNEGKQPAASEKPYISLPTPEALGQSLKDFYNEQLAPR